MDPDASFSVSEDVRRHMSLLESGASEQGSWQERADAWREAHPDLARDWDRAWAGDLREGCGSPCPSSPPGNRSRRDRPARR